MNVNKISKVYFAVCLFFLYPSLRLSFNPLGCSCFFRLYKEDRFLYQKKESLTVIASPACDHPVWKSKGLSGFRQLCQVVSLILNVIIYKSSKTRRKPKQFCPKMCLMYSLPCRTPSGSEKEHRLREVSA